MDDRRASGPIGLGVIGLGRGFMLTLPALRAHPGVRLVAAVDPRPDARAAFSREFSARAYAGIEALLADPAVEAVYIASPHGSHASQAMAAARSGKHVLVEKPMATNVADCVAMAKAAEVAGTTLMVGPSHGFDAPVQQAASLIESGAYGRVRMITALNYTDFLYRLRRPEELDTSRGGGVVYSQAAHQIDIVRRLAGSEVESVRATVGAWDPARAGDGAYGAFLSFTNGAVAMLTYSGYGRYDSDELMGWVSELGYPKDENTYGASRRTLAALAGADEAKAKLSRTYGQDGPHTPSPPPPHHEHFGFILISCEGGDLRLTPSGVWVYGADERRFVAIAPPPFARADVLDAFVAVVRGERPPVQDGTWGAMTTACCSALLLSSAEQRTVTIHSLFAS